MIKIFFFAKSINQFFGCTGVASEISASSDIISTDTYIAYENGDLTKPVRLAILNIIDDFTQISELYSDFWILLRFQIFNQI